MASSTTNRRQGVNSGAAIKVPCRCATTANITLSGLQTIDGITVVADDRVLVKDQATGADNGIYVASSSTWQRALDWDGTFDVVQGTSVYVANGTSNADQTFRLTTANPITIGTTSLTFDSEVDDVVWTKISAGSGSKTTANGDSEIVYQVAQTTASRISWRITESVAGVSTGTPVLFQVDTAASSTAIPFLVKSRGSEAFRVGATSGIGIGGNVFLESDAAEALAQRNGTSAQIWRVYNTFTSASDYERGTFKWVANTLRIGTETSSGFARPVALVVDDVSVMALNGTQVIVSDGVELRFQTDNTKDIGAAGSQRPRDIHVGRDVVVARWIQQAEVASDPSTSDLTADAEVAIYNKNDKLVFAYNNGGTMTYISIPLDGSTTTWTHSTSAP